jgi:hypothetical protein
MKHLSGRMPRLLTIASSIVLIILSLSCNNQATISEPSSASISETTKVDSKNVTDIDNGIPLFYNMCLSVELSSMFSDASAIFDNTIINPNNNYIIYQLSYDKALNLGVYAVDLCYANVFDQYGLCSKYLQSMIKLSDELGIPYHLISEINSNAKMINNRDSLYFYANRIYNQTKEYLSANDQEYALSLIIAGGWIEAMYLALKVAEQTASMKIIERIADQKNSTAQLIDVLNKERNNRIVAGYITKIKIIETDLNHFAENYMNKSGINAFNLLLNDVTQLRNQVIQTNAK